MNKFSVATLCSALLLVSTVNAQALDVKLAACAETKDSLARLVCFDALATSVPQQASTMLADNATNPPAASDIPAPTLAHVTPVAVDAKVLPTETNVASDQVAKFGAEHLKKSSDDSQEYEQIQATVASVKKNQYGQLMLTFENGQLWKQTDNSWFRVSLGGQVLLTKGVMGAVYLKKADASSHKKIRVKRIK